MARQQSPPRYSYPQPYERVPVSPLVTSPPRYGQAISGVSSSQSLRNPHTNQDAYDLNQHVVSPVMSRAPSVASDRYSTVSGLTANYFSSNPQNVNPAPAYVAPFGATQVVSEHCTANQPPSSDDEDSKSSKEDVQFSGPALALINTFLDQLLFSFLSTARSTSLLALKPAVVDVLKQRLAKDAIASAEDELKELLSGGDEEEELNTKQNAAENKRRWDLELVWKRTRLRVMVYMRLGELEDEDEERYVKEEQLFQGNERRFSQNSGLVSWAAAIFLTGVLEYVAEQTLQAAGNAAYSRDRRQHRSTLTTNSSEEQKPVLVEEHDVEKVALSPTLGRLWRTWRKLLRSNTVPSTSNYRSALGRLSTDSMGSMAEGSVNGDKALGLDDVPEMGYPEHVIASNIPLPLGDRRRDVDEIEVPGLARDPDAADGIHGDVTPPGRRNSFTGPLDFRSNGGLPTPDSTAPSRQSRLVEKPGLTRQRSSSVPTPAPTPTVAEMLRLAPGAFPEDVSSETNAGAADQKVQNHGTEKDHAAEPKANAAEMAAHKQSVPDVKSLLDKVVNHEAPDETVEQTQKSESHGLIAGAVAGATAAAAAAAAALVRGEEYDPYKPAEARSADTRGADPAQDIVSSQPARSAAYDKDAMEWDTHKSLINMKALLASGQVSKRVDDRPRTPPKVARNSSDESGASYTLRGPDSQTVPQKSPAKRQHLSAETVAADPQAVSGAGTVEDTKSPAEDSQARDVKKRPAKLHLPGTPQRSTFDSTAVKKSESPKTPREFLESRSISASNLRADSNRLSQTPPVEQGRIIPIKQPQKRRSIPGVAFTSAAATPVLERNPHRQSWSAVVQQQREHHDGSARPLSVPAVPNLPAPHKSTFTGSPVQEHPVVQRMASLKRHERKSESPVEGDHGLTSASIRGPEDFDMFVQGAETMKYTLTPQTVRDQPAQTYEKPRSPVELSSAPSVSRRRPINPTNPAEAAETRTGRSSVPKQATSATAVPLAASVGDADERRSRDRDQDKRRSVSKPSPRNVSAHRRSGLMAREPRVLTESTRDIADFIRSTGPSKEQEVKPVVNPANMSTTSLHSLRSAHINGASSRASSIASQDRARSMTRANIEAENIPPVPPVPSKGKSSMQPRSGSSAGNGNSELIDFIRSGPKDDGQHRISRSVAPFRSTMDSDQLQPMGDQINGGKPQGLKLDTNVRPSQGPPSAKSQRSTKQTPSRSNHRSSMVNGHPTNTVHPAHSGEPQRLSTLHPKSPAAESASGRRRYRNKDPYAIDLDDDNDDDLLTALPKNQRREESLMDFLNDTEPPKDNAPRPLVNGSGAQARSAMNKSRVNSMNSLRSANAGSSGGARTVQGGPGPRPGAPGAPGSARPGSGAGALAAGPPAPKPKLEARTPGEASKDTSGSGGFGSFSKQSGTKELADFLKHSGPDEDKSAPAPSVGRQSKLSPKDAAKAQKKVEKESLLSKGKRGFFGKKKAWLPAT